MSSSSAALGNASSSANLNGTTLPPEITMGIIQAYAVAIRPSITFIMLQTVFTSMLIPVLIALFLFSTHQLRRRPIFVLNVLSLLLAVGLGIWNDYTEIIAICDPNTALSTSQFMAYGICLQLAPWLSELVLLIRVLAVLPPQHTPRIRLSMILSPSVILKVARIICMANFYVKFVKFSRGARNSIQAIQSFDLEGSGWTRAGQFCEMFDNAYISGIFLWKLWRSNFIRDSDGHRVSSGSQDSFASKVRTLFMIAVANFLFPVIFNIAIVIMIYTLPGPGQRELDYQYVLVTNYEVTVISVVFATLWNTTSGFKQRLTSPSQATSDAPRSRLVFNVVHERQSNDTDTEVSQTGLFSESHKGNQGN